VYSTPDEVRLTLAPLLPGDVLRDGPEGLPDEQIIDAIREADGKIDGYLAARYAVPVQPLSTGPDVYPAQVNAWSRDIAAYRLALTAHKLRPMDQNSPAALRYAAAMTDLTAVQKGVYVLSLPGVAAPEPSVGEVAVVPQPAVFDERDWGVHPELYRPGVMGGRGGW